MNTHHLQKIAVSLLLGSILSVTQTPAMAVSIAQSPLTLGASSILPNIMLMIDDSGSMGSNNVLVVGANLTPTGPVPVDFSYDCNSANAVSGGSATPSSAPTAIAMKISTVITGTKTGPGSLAFCDDASCSTTTRFGKSSKCFDKDKYYNVTYYGGTALTGGPFSGNNLNWYFSTGSFVAGTTLNRSSTAWTRMMIAKAAAINLINAQTPKAGEKPTVRLGLTSFDEPQGGRILVPMTDLKAATCIAPDTANCNTLAATLKTKIGTTGDSSGSITPNGYTPLAEALADIGRYFCIGNTTGKLTIHPAPVTADTKTLPIGEVLGTSTTATPDTPASLSNNNNGLTVPAGVVLTPPSPKQTDYPIQYYCQKNAVILITDGLPNKDREISPHLRNYTGDCGTNAATAATSPYKCDATPTQDGAQDLSNETPPTAANHPMGIAPNGTDIPTPIPATKCKESSGFTSDGATPANTKDYLNNIACKNGTKKGRVYEILGSDYLDDVAQALFDMDLRPKASWDYKPDAVKNNLRTYAVGIADPVLQGDGVLRDAAKLGGGSFEYASDFGSLIDALDKIIDSIRKGVGSFSAIVSNASQLSSDAALFQAKYDTASWTGDFIALPVSISEDKNKNNTLDLGPPTEDTNGNGVLDKGGIVLPEAWNVGKVSPLRNLNNAEWQLRKLYTYNAANKGILFDTASCSSLSTSQKTALGITTNCLTTDSGVWRLNYVRGDTSHEVADTLHKSKYTDPRASDNNTAANRIFRNRARFYEDDSLLQDPWLLGDIVNSDAAYVSNQNYGYATLAGIGAESSSYKAFVGEPAKPAVGSTLATPATGKYAWRKMLYIGANDGFLHGFDARIPAQVTPAPLDPKNTTYVADAEAGKEIFAYLPNGVFSGLKSLSSPDYVHRYFVDGSPKVSDVYFNNNWHTVLVGTTGAGGKSIFALDITNPDAFSASKVLWELNDDVANIPANLTGADITTFTNNFINNIGYTMQQPYIGKMRNGKWAAIVSNGYLSANGRAVLFIIDIATGSIIKTLDTGTGSPTNSNGLSAPLAIDYDATGAIDGVVDAIYAGDLLGNMWKFDVSDISENNWKVAYGSSTLSCSVETTTTPSNCKPLFKTPCTVATTTTPSVCQPITNVPQAGKVGSGQTPSTSVMVYFGTGKYFEAADNEVTTTQTQSFYGVWDECPLGGDTTKCATTVPKTSLLQQTINTQTLADGTLVTATNIATATNPEVRTTSANTINYPTQKGWYIDFLNPNTSKNEGERIVSASLLRGGRIIFVTLIPIPITSANDTPSCTAGSKSTSWLTELNALTGAGPDVPVLDISGNMSIGEEDKVLLGSSGSSKTPTAPSATKLQDGSSDTPAIVDNPDDSNELKCMGSSEAKTPKCIAELRSISSDKGSARQSWKQIIN